jgi:hypothetical protein
MLILAKPPVVTPVWSLIATTSVLTPAGNATTPAFNTTGADLLVALNSGGYAPNEGSISDSKGNIWNQAVETRIGTGIYAAILYCHNPIVGSGHTVTFNCTNDQYGSLSVAAFSGSQTADPVVDQLNSNSASTSVPTANPGSITPTAGNALIITGLTMSPDVGTTGGTSFNIDSSFIILASHPFLGGTNYGGAFAYLAQSNAATVNPTWGWVPTGLSQYTCVIVSFKGK